MDRCYFADISGCKDIGIRKSCSGRRFYQYNEDDFRIQFWCKLSCNTAWKHKIIEVKRIYQFKKLLFDYKLVIWKKLVNNQILNKKVVFIVVIQSLIIVLYRFKGSVNVIWSEPPFLELQIRFTPVLFKALSDQA